METIYKYVVKFDGVTECDVPSGGKIVHFAIQGDRFCFWMQVNPLNEIVTRKFVIVGTGHNIYANMKYIGSTLEDIYVWHLFEVVNG